MPALPGHSLAGGSCSMVTVTPIPAPWNRVPTQARPGSPWAIWFPVPMVVQVVHRRNCHYWQFCRHRKSAIIHFRRRKNRRLARSGWFGMPMICER